MTELFTSVKIRRKDGSQFWHYCPFCGNLIEEKVFRHLEQMHNDLESVRFILRLPKHSVERLLQVILLLNMGDYNHNMNVLKEGQGEMLVWWKGPDTADGKCSPWDFKPCTFCKKFLHKLELDHHGRSCKIRNFYQLEMQTDTGAGM